jgi:hypothetical protein
MTRFSFFSIFRLAICIAIILCLYPAGFPSGNFAQASILMPGGVFLAQAESTAEEDSPSDTGLPSGPLAHEKTGSRVSARFYAGANYRVDELNWNIAGNMDGTNPNILSELTWEDLNIYEFSLGFSSLVKETVYFRAYMNYGRINSGENQDSDYNADNRQDEWSRSNNSTDDGSTIDVSLGAGLIVPLFSDAFAIMPMVGLSYHRQNLTMTDGYQTIPNTGPFPGLDSTYEAEWRGPWVGFEIQLDMETGQRFVPRIYPFAGFEYHWALYDAKADWNLREDFDHPLSFEHEAEGNGIRIVAGLGAYLSESWSLEVGYTQQAWSIEDGTDRVYFSDGTYGETRLNEVNWESRSLGLAVRYQF